MRIVRLWLVPLAALALACGQAGSSDPVAIGQRVYQANCTACHSPDPTNDGTMGPAIAGSSLALIEARVLRAEYPPGYTPKRDSKLMPAQPFLKPDLPALAAYLGSLPAK